MSNLSDDHGLQSQGGNDARDNLFELEGLLAAILVEIQDLRNQFQQRNAQLGDEAQRNDPELNRIAGLIFDKQDAYDRLHHQVYGVPFSNRPLPGDQHSQFSNGPGSRLTGAHSSRGSMVRQREDPEVTSRRERSRSPPPRAPCRKPGCVLQFGRKGLKGRKRLTTLKRDLRTLKNLH